ncbi:hypothetical protein D9756_003428 [Leucocoprinus leucothites]|uniref:G domain-containing protein n=1 Tax=Leucocoprinus leucothites TaxID=201217 RepID=A0A8H5G7G8_9AGAR|nr:hypothetical protein D9756_003428 [Leucoagaricus leucothites]
MISSTRRSPERAFPMTLERTCSWGILSVSGTCNALTALVCSMRKRGGFPSSEIRFRSVTEIGPSKRPKPPRSLIQSNDSLSVYTLPSPHRRIPIHVSQSPMLRSESRSGSIPQSNANNSPLNHTRRSNPQKSSATQTISVAPTPSRVSQDGPVDLQHLSNRSGEKMKSKDPESSSVISFPASEKGDSNTRDSSLLKSLYPRFMFKKEKASPATVASQASSTRPISRKIWRHLKKESQTVKTEELKESDTVIALMGPTGSGKSSLISTLAEADQGVGHDLMSHTSEIKAIRVRVPDEDFEVVLVDTPGFDDTYKSDYEILQMISEWIKQVGHQNILLDGILYLHRISDNRMAGTPLRNLDVFEKLCGPQAFSRVVMVTTMWDEVEEDMGMRRENELISSFWRPMMSRGSETVRYLNTADSAWGILGRFLEGPRERLKAIQLQKETVKQQKTLSKTDAGQELYNKLDELDKKRRALIRSLEKQMKRSGTNEEMVAILRQQHDELERQRKEAIGELQELKVSVPQRFMKSFAMKARYRS